MPGLNIHFKTNRNSRPANGDAYSSLVFSSDSAYVSVETGNSGHPVDVWESQDGFFAFEGYAFDWKNPRQELESLVERLVKSEKTKEILENTFGNLDAEFVFFFHHKPSGKCGMVNDVLGRFPIYSCATDDGHIFSRNASFPGKLKKLSLDLQGAAESMTFGFTLGNRTVYEDVKRLAGGSFVFHDGKELTIDQYKTIDYDQLLESKPDPQKALNQATELFVSALESRTKFCDTPILALSGGLDSRALFGGFDKLGIDFETVTYQDEAGSAERDVEVAGLIAKAHDKELDLINLGTPEEKDFLELFDFKKGHSMLDMAFMVPFLRKLRERSENAAMFTGDGGDKVLPSLLPDSRVFKGKKLMTYALRANRKFSEATAEEIFGIPSGSVKRAIEELFESYPEKSWEGKFTHFTMENRARNWLFEGEDRNRCFLPSFTPFYSFPLFELLISADEKDKRDFKFFHQFLRKISPKSALIKNANWGFGVSEQEQIRKIYFRQDLKLTKTGSFVKNRLQPKANYLNKATEVERRLFEQLSKKKSVFDKIDLDLIRKLKGFEADPFHFLITLMKVAEETR